MPGARRTNNQPARLQEALVLHKYILNLFGCKDLEALSRDLKDPALEGVDDERLRVGASAGMGTSRFYYVLKQHQYDLHISQEKLFECDKNIVSHTNEINERRPEKIQWKYYQYLNTKGTVLSVLLSVLQIAETTDGEEIYQGCRADPIGGATASRRTCSPKMGFSCNTMTSPAVRCKKNEKCEQFIKNQAKRNRFLMICLYFSWLDAIFLVILQRKSSSYEKRNSHRT